MKTWARSLFCAGRSGAWVFVVAPRSSSKISAHLDHRPFHILGDGEMLVARHAATVGMQNISPVTGEEGRTAPLKIIEKGFRAKFDRAAAAHPEALRYAVKLGPSLVRNTKKWHPEGGHKNIV